MLLCHTSSHGILSYCTSGTLSKTRTCDSVNTGLGDLAPTVPEAPRRARRVCAFASRGKVVVTVQTEDTGIAR